MRAVCDRGAVEWPANVKAVLMSAVARYTRWVLGTVLAALVSLQLMPHVVEADLSIAVSPTFIELGGDPGASTRQAVAVANEGAETLSISIAIGDMMSAQPGNSAATWLSADTQHMVLEPGESRDVAVSIRIPRNASLGGHFAVLCVQASTAGLGKGLEGQNGGASTGASVLSSFMVTVRSRDPSDLRLEGAVAKVVPIAQGEDGLGFRVEVENRGNVHFVPRGAMELKDGEGNSVGALPLPEGIPVLPGTTRSYYFSGVLEVPPGDYTAFARVDCSWEGWQAEVVGADPGLWSAREAVAEHAFSSVPRLRINSITPMVEANDGLSIGVEVENAGDVEVAPQGYLEFRLLDGQELFAAGLGSPTGWIAPHSSMVAWVGYGGIVPGGDYEASSVLGYCGEEVEKDAVIAIEEDIVPVLDVPSESSSQPPVVWGVSTWTAITAPAAGVIGIVALTLAVRRRRLHRQ
jgi:hypothetical protein